ncbi:MAG: tRNA (adenosine(37)-N6)-dimethylallyltransferase MiaA [Bacilli bacterium]|nr:tRNA (adenosine(37)-N6)-dimethylallyltransferase MiaA [Bacilli bacterium]
MIILLLGPTAIGKTNLSIFLAKKLEAKIINTDRMAMIKETNIGTAKISEEEMQGIKHYFINNLHIDDEYSIYDFQKEGRKILNELIKNNDNVIIVGGSNLYTKALLYDYKLYEEDKTNDLFDNLSNEELKSLADNLNQNDIHKNNRNRLIRFINSYKNGNKINNEINQKNKPLYDFKIIGLKTDREILYNIINIRVDKMIEKGLFEEAKGLYEKKYKNLSNIIGYKELIPYFQGQISKETAVDNLKKDTRRYAKRQMTWLNHQFGNIKWFEVQFNAFDNTKKEVMDYITSLQ